VQANMRAGGSVCTGHGFGHVCWAWSAVQLTCAPLWGGAGQSLVHVLWALQALCQTTKGLCSPGLRGAGGRQPGRVEGVAVGCVLIGISHQVSVAIHCMVCVGVFMAAWDCRRGTLPFPMTSCVHTWGCREWQRSCSCGAVHQQAPAHTPGIWCGSLCICGQLGLLPLVPVPGWLGGVKRGSCPKAAQALTQSRHCCSCGRGGWRNPQGVACTAAHCARLLYTLQVGRVVSACVAPCWKLCQWLGCAVSLSRYSRPGQQLTHSQVAAATAAVEWRDTKSHLQQECLGKVCIIAAVAAVVGLRRCFHCTCSTGLAV
jgi:hypothetical protein